MTGEALPGIDEHYADAIDLLTGPPLDYKFIVIQLAKSDPGTFVALARMAAGTKDLKVVDEVVGLPPKRAMDDGVIRLLCRNAKVNAIKFVRDCTGLRLKESKDYVDALDAWRAHAITGIPSVALPPRTGVCVTAEMFRQYGLPVPVIANSAGYTPSTTVESSFA